jgi:hypothetical protein
MAPIREFWCMPLALRIADMFLHASPHRSAERVIAAMADERKRLGRLKLEGSADLGRSTRDVLNLVHELEQKGGSAFLP